MLRAAAGDPSRKEPFSVPTKDPRVDVAPARAVLDGRVSPEKEQRVNAQESEVRGQRSGRPVPLPLPSCTICIGRGGAIPGVHPRAQKGG